MSKRCPLSTRVHSAVVELSCPTCLWSVVFVNGRRYEAAAGAACKCEPGAMTQAPRPAEPLRAR